MITADRVKRLLLAAILAFLLGIVGATIAPQGDGGNVFAFLFLVGTVVFAVVLLKASRVGFWFCLLYAFEWAFLPIAAAINAGQTKETGCAGFGAAIAAGLLLALTIPVGAVGFFLFLALALLRFRKKNQAQGTWEQPDGGVGGASD
jgi:hypothetical protein